jgi:transposase
MRARLISVQRGEESHPRNACRPGHRRGARAPLDKAGRQWLDELELPEVQRLLIDCPLELIDSVHEPIARLEKEIGALTRPDLRVKALQALSGIGPYTAMTLVAEIGDIARFPSPRKLCAWAGYPQHAQLRGQGPPRPHN